jgi:hypothetical protein
MKMEGGQEIGENPFPTDMGPAEGVDFRHVSFNINEVMKTAEDKFSSVSNEERVAR